MNTLIKLFDASVETIARPLAYSLKKGGASYPKFRQTIIKIGQSYHDTPVDEEKAIQTAANFIIRKTTKGAYYIAAVYAVRMVYLDYRNTSESEQKTKQRIESTKQALEKAEQQLNRFRQELKAFKQIKDDLSKAEIRAQAKAAGSEP